MHSKGVIHRDLKLGNLILNKNLNPILLDFGYATNEHITKLSETRGSKFYMPPEINEEKEYDGKSADIFSLGVLLFGLVVGKYPFGEFADKDD